MGVSSQCAAEAPAMARTPVSTPRPNAVDIPMLNPRAWTAEGLAREWRARKRLRRGRLSGRRANIVPIPCRCWRRYHQELHWSV